MVAEFDYYLKIGLVKKSFVDRNRAKSLIKIASERLTLAKKLENPNFKLEMSYEAIIECIEAIMSLKGYKSYSHEANIAFLKNIGFQESEIIKIDNLRKLRHRSKYYGESISKEVSKNAIKVAEITIQKLINLFKSMK